MSFDDLIEEDYFNPRPPRGGRRVVVFASANGALISIHALREEGDRLSHSFGSKKIHFNPRPPRGGRPFGGEGGTRTHVLISIHALREEGDPLPGATGCTGVISIHALREEGDLRVMMIISVFLNFNPRPPRGGRREKLGERE